jgi:DNA repair protein RadC
MEAVSPVHLPRCDRPRERLLAGRSRQLSTAELIAAVVGNRRADSLAFAHRLLGALGAGSADPLVHLRDTSAAELRHCAGMGPACAARLLAALELGRRVYLEQPIGRAVIDSPDKVAILLAGDLAVARQEQFAVLLLDTKNRLVAHRIVSLGTIDETIAHPREVFREAIRQGAAGTIVAHNHPSGITEPSAEDLHLTEQLLACGRTLQIPVLDHVIVGAGGFTSLRRTTRLWQ